MKILISFLTVFFIYGCATKPIQVHVDTSTMDDLSKEMALDFLRQTADAADRSYFAKSYLKLDQMICRYEEASVSSELFGKLRYDETTVDAQIWHDSWLVVRLLKPDKQLLCYASMQLVKNQDNLANKAATALKSLGVKISEKKTKQ